MTPDVERAIREDLDAGHRPLRGAMAMALAEIDRLRALPVLATCGACGWCGPTSGGWSCDHPASIAAVQRTIPGCPQGGHVEHDAPPPADCPLRGAR